ncbi:hypothetical protein H2201_002735 [Coniosporium apollinis]|uniref:N-acetyltransferase domain-containing protein n=1 Tax=Coniosporium apollinis TaxID=61459 RepID=A0ABQ9NXW2_9PEZI|nr:hypothetical protein H2201_002735 [Coniosporium apollinis]
MSSTEFMSFLPPPGPSISNYDRHSPSTAQSASVPATFKEAMSIREAVFVEEQHVPLENELDYDDPRSFHWVVYASVGTSSSSPSGSRPSTRSRKDSTSAEDRRQEERRRSSATASRVAVGTIRLVPPPHPPHPSPGTAHKIDNKEVPLSSSPEQAESRHPLPTPLHDNREPYVKLGRLATLQPYRGLGLARLLVNAALDWAAKHPDEVVPPPDPTAVEQAKVEGKLAEEADGRWRGLVLVHAQTGVAGWWEGMGFRKDEGMGTWVEEGIEHVGMWRRVAVKGG